jgi:integrase
VRFIEVDEILYTVFISGKKFDDVAQGLQTITGAGFAIGANDIEFSLIHLGSAWKRSLQRAAIVDFRFHDLRHTWASWHVMSGTSLQELMELGGWKSYEMVLRYAHLVPEHLADAAARIERRLEVVESYSTISLR